MKYLPILQELFESDTVIFLAIGIAAAVMAGLKLKNLRKCLTCIIISAATYAACEIISNIRPNYMIEFMALFIGTTAIGCCIGFAICSLFQKLRHKW